LLVEAYPEVENTIYAYPDKGPGEDVFTQKYMEKYNTFPAPSVAYAYDAVNLVADALKAGKTSPEEIAEYLKSIQDYQGISNTITFDNNGRITQKPHIIKTVKDGKFVEITQ